MSENNKPIKKFTLRNQNGMSVDITNYGATITAINVPDRNGKFDDVVLGFKNIEDYKNKEHPHFGGTVGRYANRIKHGKFSLDSEEYEVTRNHGEHHLHGGEKCFDQVEWKVESHGTHHVTLSHRSPDGDEGYPGNLDVTVTYRLNEQNELSIKYEAQTDKAMPVNLTNHSYFNLKGEGKGNISKHKISINASHYTPVDDELIPTGEIASVDGTRFDLRKLPSKHDLQIANAADANFQLIENYDHYFVGKQNPDGSLYQIAKVLEPETGRVLEVKTTEPGVQLCTADWLGDIGIDSKDGSSKYEAMGGVCLETHHPADSPNHPQFPSTILRPSETYSSETVYGFSVNKEQGIAR